MIEGAAQKKETNELFQSFLHQNEEEAEKILSLLILDHAEPIARKIVQYKLQGSASIYVEREDLTNDILVELLSRLRDLRASNDENTIQSFSDYVAVVSYNACHHYFRRKYPRREALKNRLRYIFKHDRDFAIWEQKERLICGESGWSGRQDCLSKDALSEFAFPDSDIEKTRDNLKVLFRKLRSPVQLEDLVDCFTQSWNRKERISEEIPKRMKESSQTDPVMLHKLHLAEAWKEIQLLPVKQRIALLLNMRDEQGSAALVVFPSTGIASARKIAEVMEIKAEDLAALWKDLPLEDLRIAEMLGITRQQVINLRKCARERLSRRFRFH